MAQIMYYAFWQKHFCAFCRVSHLRKSLAITQAIAVRKFPDCVISCAYVFSIAKFTIWWFCNNSPLRKISDIWETAFILIVFLASSIVGMNMVSLNWLENLWIIKIVWWLSLSCFFNKLNEDSFIFNIWCVKNPYEPMN